MAEFPAALDAALAAYYGTGTGQAPLGARLGPVAEVRSPITSARGLGARVRQMERAYGGPKQAAKAAGVSPRTWQGWKTGKSKPSKASIGKVGKAHQRLADAKSRKRSTGGKRPPRLMSVTATVVVDPARSRYTNAANRGRRTFNADSTALRLGKAVDAWVRGLGPGVVALIAQQAVAEAYSMDGIAFEGDQAQVTLS